MELRAASWRIWLERVLLGVGAALVLAAIVYFFAFNWARVPGWARFALAEGLFVLAAVWALAARPGAPRDTSLLAAGTLAGVFWAVFGQYYQTGADAWQLFALWTAFLLPWLALARTAALANFTLIVANIALALYGRGFEGSAAEAFTGLPAMALNAAALTLSLGLGRTLRDLAAQKAAWRAALLPAILLAAAATGRLCAFLLTMHDGGGGGFTAAVALAALAGLKLASLFLPYPPGMYVLALCGFPLINYALYAALDTNFLKALPLLLVAYTLLNLGYAFALAKLLPRFVGVPPALWFRRADAKTAGPSAEPSPAPSAEPSPAPSAEPSPAPSASEPGLAHQIVLGVGAVLTAFFLLALTAYLLLVSLDAGSSAPFYVVGIVFGVGGAALFRAGRGEGVFLKTLGAAVATAGLTCLLIVLIIDAGVRGAALPFAILAAAFYAALPWAPLRFAASAAAFGLLLVALGSWGSWGSWDAWGAWDAYSWGNARAVTAAPGLGVLALPLIGAALGLSAPKALRPAVAAALATLLIALPDWADISRHAITAGGGGIPDPAFLSAEIARAALALIPLTALLILMFRASGKRATLWQPPLAAGLLLIWAFGPTETLFALALLALGHARNERGLTIMGGAALTVFLFNYYYSLELTLLAKSLRMGLAGAVLLAGGAAAALWPGEPGEGKKERQTPARASWRFTRQGALAAAVAALTLASFQYAVFDKERLLASGEEILLPLAPLDPRSLMQGDYMRLDYAIDRELRYWRDPDAMDNGGLPAPRAPRFALLDREILPNGRQAGRFAGLDTGNNHKREQLALALRPDGYAPEARLPDSFLFQEGLAPLYEKARYAILRCAPSGSCLLTGLADEDGNTLEAKP